MSDCSKKRVAMVGSGNFACAIVRNVGDNVKEKSDLFHPTVNMWTFQEEVAHPDTGQMANLTDIINSKHENVKYLPGVKLPENIVSVPDMGKAVEGADILIICMPHQFIAGSCRAIRKGLSDKKVLAVSLVKGFHCDAETGEFELVTKVINKNLDVECGCLMGANLADEIAKGGFCESTLACSTGDEDSALLKELFCRPNFRVNTISDVHSAEMCGALKNIVAVGAGMADGLGMGHNTKAALVRLGLIEMINFVRHVHGGSCVTTFFESCGVADLMTTCYGGRNRLVGEAFAKAQPRKSLLELEAELLGGQKLQGPLTAQEVADKLQEDKIADQYPLFMVVNRICRGELDPEELIQTLQRQPDNYGKLTLF